uniref:Uncharacterized protein n=1 Tax=Heterorhabditis bacteriophora TaxID=37862 RepID=A0A1I7XTX5_HETBA
MGSSISTWIIFRIPILELPLLWKVPTHESEPPSLVTLFSFQPLLFLIIKLNADSSNNQFSHLMDMLKYCCGEMTIAKSLTASIANGTLAPRYIRPAEQRRQQEIHGDMRNFQQFLIQLDGILPTSRNIKSFLDCIAHRMA